MLENQKTHPSRLPLIPSLDGMPVGARPTPAEPAAPVSDVVAADHRLSSLLNIEQCAATDASTPPAKRPIRALPYRNRTPQPDPIGAAMFPVMRSIDSKYRLMLVYEASATLSLQERAEAIALTGHVGALFSGTDVEPRMLRHYWNADGTMTSFASFQSDLRHRPEFVAAFDSAVAEVRCLFEVLGNLPGRLEHTDRVRSCYLRRYALVQLNLMSPDQRLQVAANAGGTRLSQALGITFLTESLFLSHTIGRHMKGEPLPVFTNDARLAVESAQLPPAQAAVWTHVAAVLAGALAGPIYIVKSRPAASPPVYSLPTNSRAEVRLLDRQLAEAASLPGSAEACEIQNCKAIVMTEQLRFLGLLKQLRRHSPDWSDVAESLCLSTREFPDGRLGAYMTGSGLHQSLERERAHAFLRARATCPRQAALDEAAARLLMQRLERQIETQDTSSMREKRLRRTATDDLVAAASHLTPGQRAACLRYYGARNFLQRLDLEVVGNIRRVINHEGLWHASQKKRVAGLLIDQSRSYVPRPDRVATIRASLAVLLTLVEVRPVSPHGEAGRLPHADEAGLPLSPDVDMDMDVDVDVDVDDDSDGDSGVEPMAFVKPEPEVQAAAVQRYDSAIVALRPDGSDWLEGLDVSAAIVGPQAWADFERESGATGRMSVLQRQSLSQRLSSEVARMLSKPQDAAALAERFEFVTTLDEHERGRGVVTRAALPALTLLFPYGGTVCADGQASDAYRLQYPEAWKYAMCVNLPGTVVTDGTAAPGATCYGFPVGSMATIVNTRRLHGSEQQLRRAANVGAVAVSIAGLPFAIPMLVTLQDLPAGTELFLNYGLQFSRFVLSSLAALPRWPTVKVEPGLRPPPTLQHFLSVYRDLPSDGPHRLAAEPAMPPARFAQRPDWPALLVGQGCTVRQVPPGGDSCLQALEGHTLDAPRLQEARHDLADAMARLPDTGVSDAANAAHIAEALRGTPPGTRGVAAPYPARVSHAVHADFQRIPGAPANSSVISAWCALNDERLRSRAAEGRRKPPATQVLLLAESGEFTLFSASGSRVVSLAGLGETEVLARLGGAIAASQVALLQNGGDYLEIVHRG
jgi:hypothetical protein